MPDTSSLIAEEEPVCQPREVKAGDKVGPQEVTVSVYNAGGRSGMASKTLQSLIERGFAPGKSGNIEADEVKWVQVWTDTRKNPAARLVARQFGKKVKVAVKEPKDLPGLGVVVVVGPGLEGLINDAPTSQTAKAASSFCSPPVT